MNRLKDFQKKESAIFWSGLIVALMCLLLRTSSSYFPGEYLWGEDGNIFINQAATLGVTSLWTPYAGYLHTYNRIIALICNSFSLTLTAYVFYVAWLVSFSAMILVLIHCARRLQFSKMHIYGLVFFISLQPTVIGEIFFTLTNSQWPMGAALFIYLLTRENKPTSLLEFFLITLACLSGPFCVFIFPFFLIKTLIEKNLNRAWPIILVLLITTIVQLIFIIKFRDNPATYGHILGIWLKLIISVLLFNASNFITILAAFLFWGCVAASFSYLLKNKSYLQQKSLIYLWFFSFFFVFICTYTRIPYHEFVDRYRFIPYVLFFFGAIGLTSNSRKATLFLFLSLTLLCFSGNFKLPHRNYYQFHSYVNFSKYISLTIPIDPQPNWGAIHRPFKPPISPLQSHDFNIFYFSGHSLITKRLNGILDLNLLVGDAYLIFNRPIYCPFASDIGIEVDLFRKKEGVSRLFWSNNNTFKRKKSLSVFYPAGQIKEHFAFKNSKDKIYIRFYPNYTDDQVQIKSLKFYCLP